MESWDFEGLIRLAVENKVKVGQTYVNQVGQELYFDGTFFVGQSFDIDSIWKEIEINWYK